MPARRLRHQPRLLRGLTLAWGLALACAPRANPSAAPSAAPSSTAQAVEPTVAPALPKISEDATVQRLFELAQEEPQVDAHLAYLTQTFGPRLTSSHALMAAERWATEQFARWGLDARLEPWGEFPVGFDRGPWSGGMVSPRSESYDFITRAWTPGVAGPLRGPARIYPGSTGEAKKLGKAAKGAWIVVPRTARGQVDAAKREKIDAVLREAGVAGFVLAAGDPEGELVHTSGNHQIDWADLPVDVRVRLRADQHAALVEFLAPKAGDPSPVELEFSIHNSFFRGPVVQNNVIADIVGSEKPDELVIVGGHLDSWDGAVGAVDNGTGVATTLEAARLLMAAGARPKRTIRFMLWSGEEQGLYGSRRYVEDHPELLERISAVFVHDGGTNFLAGLFVTPEMLEDAKALFAPLRSLSSDHPFHLRLTRELQTGGSDHSPFAREGVPAFFWIQDGRADYDHAHHTQFDTLDAAIPEYQRHSALVVAIAAWQVANHDRLLPRENAKPLPRRELGVRFERDFVIKSLEADGVAKRAGMKAGDRVLHLEGMEELTGWQAYRAMQRGDAVKRVVIERKGKKRTLTLDWSDAPGESERRVRDEARAAAFGELDYGEVAWGEVLETPEGAETPSAR